MCEPYILDTIAQAVEKAMLSGAVFTAFDITLAVQKVGINKLHAEIRNDIKRIVKSMMGTYGYTRTFSTLPGIGAQAYIFHLPGADLNTFAPSIPYTVLPAAAPVALLAAPANVTSSLCIVRQPDKRETVSIPAELIRSAGFMPGNKAKLFYDEQAQALRIEHDNVCNNVEPLITYTVDQRYNVRITKATFHKAQLVASAYNISLGGQSISITSA
jgi:hypothetical protein